MGSQDLPDMYALSPRAYISGKSLLPMLQLICKSGYHTLILARVEWGCYNLFISYSQSFLFFPGARYNTEKASYN